MEDVDLTNEDDEDNLESFEGMAEHQEAMRFSRHGGMIVGQKGMAAPMRP